MMIALMTCIVLAALALGGTLGYQRGRKTGFISGLRKAAIELDRMNQSVQEQSR